MNTARSDIDDVVDNMSATMSGVSVDEYRQTLDNALSKVEKLEEIAKTVPKTLKNLEDYKKASEINSIASSLYYYMFNHDIEDEEKKKRITAVSNLVWKRINKFARAYGKPKDKDTRLLAKCAISCGLFYKSTVSKFGDIAQFLIEKGHLYVVDNGGSPDYYVTGLHYAVGDNTFEYDRHGKEYRFYQKTADIQAFDVNNLMAKAIENLSENIKDSIPPLPDIYSRVYVAPNVRHCAKVYISMREMGKCKTIIDNK